MLSREAANTNFIVFEVWLVRVKTMIYRTWEHANHYTTDAVNLIMIYTIMGSFCGLIVLGINIDE
jgi:hypothetical protein